MALEFYDPGWPFVAATSQGGVRARFVDIAATAALDYEARHSLIHGDNAVVINSKYFLFTY